MSARHWLRTLGLACGLVVATSSLYAWAPESGLTYLTFNRPVSLPGVTLGTGTYAFEIMNPSTSSDVVIVRDRARRTVYFSGLTNRMATSLSDSRDGAITFGQSHPNEPVQILAWYPSNGTQGRQFIYRR
jgi:hypothetical protein